MLNICNRRYCFCFVVDRFYINCICLCFYIFPSHASLSQFSDNFDGAKYSFQSVNVAERPKFKRAM